MTKLFFAFLLGSGLALAQSTAVPVKQLAAPTNALTGNWQIVIQNGVFTVIPYVAPTSTGTQVDGETYNFTAANTITLKNTPIAASPHVYRNGVRLSLNEDFTVAGAVLTFTANAPQAGDKFVIDYRY